MNRFALLSLTLVLPLAMSASALDLDRSVARDIPLTKLKETFLQCDRLAARTMLDFGTAAHCSIVYEELLKRGFDGDFNLLMQWWQGRHDAPNHSLGIPD